MTDSKGSGLIGLFEPFGTAQTLEGNEPVLVENDDFVWLVVHGGVDLFAANLLADGSPLRRYLYSLSPGDLIFGLRPAAAGARNIALLLAGSGTKVLRLERASLIEAVRMQGDLREEVSVQLERWIGAWSAALRSSAPPSGFLHLDGPGDLEVPAGTVLSSGATLWVRIAGPGGVRWMGEPAGGEDEVAVADGGEDVGTDGDVHWPLAPAAWMAVEADSGVRIARTGELLADGTIWKSLTAFHRLAAERLEGVFAREELKGREQLASRRANDSKLMARALSRLLEVTEGRRKQALAELAASSADPLYMACRVVGEAAGIDMKPSLRAPRRSRAASPLGDIARASGVRSRQVALRDEWWRDDNGPLVGFLGEDDRPVALLPGPRGYRLVHPADLSEQPVTADIAARIQPLAHMFYRSLPARPLGVKDIVRFGSERTILRDMAIAMMLGIAAGLLGLLMPIANGLLFDSVIPESNRGTLLQLIFIVAGATLTLTLFQLTRSFATLRVEARMDSSIQAAVWDRLLKLPAVFFRQYTAGDLADRANSINAIRKTIAGAATSSLFSGLFSSFNFLLLLRYDARLALAAAGLVLIALGVTLAIGLLQVRNQRELLQIRGRLSGTVLQLMNGISKFRMAAAENRAFFLWSRLFAEQKNTSYKSRLLAIGLSVFQAFYPILTSMVLFYLAASRQESLSGGQFIAFFAAFSGFLGGMMGMSSTIVSIVNVVPLFERAKPILQAVPEVREQLEDPGELSGAIEARHLRFRYREDAPLAVRDVSLQISPGEFVAFIGPSGCGKSSLMRLLLGFEQAESGSIYYDGQDMKSLDIELLRSQFGVVLQNSKTMSGDLYTNIVGASNLTVEDAWEVAAMAGLDEDIRQMPMGMHTVVSEGGGTLSGGQRQRLMIARAIARKPAILFFDEATSALDNRTQAIVSESLEKLKATRIVIAHRLSTIRNADRIFVMDKGTVLQQGTYDELMAQPGPFAELAKRQLA